MRKWLVSVCVVCAVVGLVAGLAFAALEIGIMVSPSTIVMASNGNWVTVHADIPLGLVDRSTVRLNGLAPVFTYSDTRGDLVAKYRIEDIRAIVDPPSTTLTLTGTTKDGVPFQGSDTVRVVPGKDK